MNRFAVCLLAAVASTLVVADASAQQYNLPGRGVLTFNNVDGPPWPITTVSFPRGTNQTFHMEALPNSPFVVAMSNGLSAAGIPTPLGGLVDLNLQSGFGIILNGITNPFYSVGPTGTLDGQFFIASSTPLNTTKAFQAMFADFLSPTGATMSAASRITVTPGVTTQILNIGSNSYTNFALTSYGLTIPFYAQNYSTLWINQDGSIGFNTGNGDFTPTPAEFLQQEPRIAAFWTDLEPGGASQINIQVDQSNPNLQFVTVNWVNLMEWNASGTPHTFSITIYAAPIGDIVISQGIFNNAAQYDILTGISPGNNLSTVAQHPQKNLSNIGPGTPMVGCANENFHEWYGLTSFPYYTAGFNNPWDLTGRTLTFSRYYYTPGSVIGCSSSTPGWAYIAQ